MSSIFPGFIHGCLATVATGVYQILAGTKQKQYGINALQLLHYQVLPLPGVACIPWQPEGVDCMPLARWITPHMYPRLF